MRNGSGLAVVMGTVSIVLGAALADATGGSGTIFVPIRWCGMEGTNAVENPGCVGEGSLKEVLWRRHERTSDASYIPYCNMSWRSGAIAAQPSFPVIPDPCDPAVDAACPGVTGDIFDGGNFLEYTQALQECAAAWNLLGTGVIGVIGVNVRRFVAADGSPLTVIGRGGVPAFGNVAQQVGLAGGFLATDNDFMLPRSGDDPPCVPLAYSDARDTLMGHELGHALSLQHQAGTLMNPTCCTFTRFTVGGPGQTDTSCPSPLPTPTSQCGQMRLQALCAVPLPAGSVDPPPIADQITDPIGDQSESHVDLALVALVYDDDTGQASFSWETRGVFPDTATGLEYAFAAELDGGPLTGGDPNDVGVPIPFAGAELVGRVVVDVAEIGGVKTFTATPTLWKFVGGAFVEQPTLGTLATESLLDDHTSGTDVPRAAFVEIDFERAMLEGVPGNISTIVPARALARDPTLGAEDLTADVTGDATPGNTLYLTSPALPTCEIAPGEASPRKRVVVTASGLAPNQSFHVLLGPDVVAVGTTNAAGTVAASFSVPRGTTAGIHAISIGVDDPHDAVTAECALRVLGPLCQRTIVKASSQLVGSQSKALGKCGVAKVAGKLPASTDCRVEPGTAEALAKADAKMSAAVDKVCGGADAVCAGDPSEEDGGSELGYGLLCPDLESKGCVNPIGGLDDCSGVATCVGCIASEGLSQMDGVLSDAFVPAADKAAARCQQAIVKAVWNFATAKANALAKCWEGRLDARHAEPCPVPGDGRAGRAIAKTESKMIAAICKACGGARKKCADDIATLTDASVTVEGDGQPDDLDVPTAIGVPTGCPDVTLPRPPGTSCRTLDDLDGAPDTIDSLREMILCYDCVIEFKTDCMDASRVPQFGPYPQACNP